MKIGKKILELRKKEGISQEQLGDKLNVTRQTISNWELGETQPNTEQLLLISKIFDISIDDLLDNKNNIKKSNNNILPLTILILILIITVILLIIMLFKEKDKNVVKLYKTTTSVISTTKANDTFIRTYKIEKIDKVECNSDLTGCDDTTFKVILKDCKSETKELQISNSKEFKKLKKSKIYEFTFEPLVGEVYYEDTIINIFTHNAVIKVNETDKTCNNQIRDKIKTRSN